MKVSLQTHVETRNGREYLKIERVAVKMETEKYIKDFDFADVTEPLPKSFCQLLD